MKWQKRGVIWKPDGQLWWAQQYATCPTPLVLNDETLRIYLQSRDAKGIGRVGYIDVDPNNPLDVLNIVHEPVLDIGEPGCFDDNGVFQTSIIKVGEKIRMYYVGFEICHHVRYRLLTGIAESYDGGITFQRIKKNPILERSSNELYFRCGPCVLPGEKGNFQMWYIAGSEWKEIDGKIMPVYHLRYMESPDGIQWPEEGKVILEIDRNKEHGFGRPYIVKKKDYYQMFYSIRKNNPRAYRLGYAESDDGIHWERKDHKMGLDVSQEGWDSESVEYSAVININKRTYCFYNGNDFGVTGVGVAELIK